MRQPWLCPTGSLDGERLWNMDIRDVYLNEGKADAKECVADGDTGMSVSSSINNNASNVVLASKFVNEIEDGAFVVRLKCF